MNLYQVQERFGKFLEAVKVGRTGEALETIDRLLLDQPDFMPGWEARGNYMNDLGNHFDAVLNFNQAIALAPNSPAAYNNRGSSYLSLNRSDEALESFTKAIAIKPDLAKAWMNKGNAYRRKVHIKEATAAYREAVRLDPNDADAHLGLSMCLLELQQFEEGWKEFEWRWKCGQMPPRNLPYPTWLGEASSNKNDALLICGEQGNGDVLQFIRYAKHTKAMWGGPVYVEVRFPLMRLAQEIDGIDGVVVLGERPPVNVTRQINMMSVPAIVGTEKGFEGQYLKTDPYMQGHWAKQLDQLPHGIRVGLCWAGMNRESNNTASAIDARRSLSLSQFAYPAMIKGVTWLALQKGGPSATQVKTPPSGMTIADYSDDLQDFYDTAALVSQLDLVISVDTAVAHLAAGLGIPTWMLSRFDGCWRWFGDRSDSPWYPTMTQYRQPEEGNWGPVLDRIAVDLQKFVTARRAAA